MKLAIYAYDISLRNDVPTTITDLYYLQCSSTNWWNR